MSGEREWNCDHCGNENYNDGEACTTCNFPRRFGPISKDELLARLRSMNGGMQNNHMEADALLLRFINDHEIAVAFADIDKWYS